ncbi:MAG: lysophospholipid acyltransferase family protein [Fimbriimonadales bacterium]|nr:lysophospholipid acyltransferase family protein [Fimbriimonadales bacterium]
MMQKPPWRKRIEGKLGGWGLRLAWGLFRRLPMDAAQRLGAGLGLLAYALSARYRRMAIHNLQRAFPDWTPAQARATARRVFRNFGVSMAEFFKAPSMTRAQIERQLTLVGREHLDAALREGKGVLLITGHFGNWELMARYLCMLGYPIAVIARDADDKSTTELITMLRERSGYKVFPRGNAARLVLKALRANEVVGILPDQNAGDVFVEFFGQKAGSVAGPAVFHLRTGAPLVPLFNVRLPGDYHRVEILPPMHFEPTGDAQADQQRIMQALHDVLEAYVRRYPDQWLWLHDRWKSARKRFGAGN